MEGRMEGDGDGYLDPTSQTPPWSRLLPGPGGQAHWLPGPPRHAEVGSFARAPAHGVESG
jgi:hypothetical protein